jgi:outer membrane lipoprotein carrier protein
MSVATPVHSVATVTGTVATAPTAAAPDLVGLIEEHYRGIADLTAKVVQKNYVKSVNKTQTFEGTLSVKKPGRLRLEYTNSQVIVIDGKEAWFYSKKSEQAIRRTFRDFEQANIPVAFLLGASEIRKEFEVAEPGDGEQRALDLIPRKKEQTTMRRLRLHVDDAGRITRMVIHHRSGDSADIRFSDVREGVGLDDDRFGFKVPKGTEVIEQ